MSFTTSYSTNNPWMQFLQQDPFGGMFGDSSMGLGMGAFLNGMGGCSPFTNCFGKTDYGAMLGYQIFNVVSNAAGYIASDINSNNEAKVDSRTEIKSVDSQIIDKQTEINQLNINLEKYDSEEKIAKLVDEDSNVKSANDSYDSLKKKYEGLSTEIDNPATGKKYTQAEIDAIGVKVTEAHEALEKAKADAKKSIEATRDELKEKLETAKGNLKKLEGERDTQYNKLSEKDKAKYCMSRFVTCERNEVNAKTDEEKVEAQKERYIEAERLVTLYESSTKAKKEIPEVMYNAAKDNITGHSDLKAE